MNYKKQIAKLLSDLVKDLTPQEVETLIELPPKDIEYDYSFPTYSLSKIEKKPPNEIATRLESSLEKPEFLSEIKADGPYLNFKLERKHLAKVVLKDIYEKGDTYGKITTNNPLRIVIEYPSPNTNKPLHLGHIRNILIGQSASNLQKFIGNDVFEVDLYNDRGIHICKSMLAYQKWGENKNPEEENIKSDHFVGASYVKYSLEEERNNSLIEEASTLLKLWEQNDPNTRSLWNKMNNWAINGFKETFKKFNLSFNNEYKESDIYKEGKEIILNALDNQYIERAENGAIIARLEKFNLPDKVLLRGDGTSLYITQDIYLAKKKKEDFDYDKSIIVAGSEQNTYFKQLFKVLELIGFKEEMHHLSYGMIYLPEGKMKSREGQTVDADDLIQEMEDLAQEEIEKRYETLDNKEKAHRAKIIGDAALRFFILKYDTKKDFTYDPAQSISFEGDTGPYVQYVYARIQSIIDKAELKINSAVDFSLLTHKTEHELLFLQYRFPEVIEEAANSFKPHLICQYLINLSQQFNNFYDNCPVISSESELKKARLLLIRCVQTIIKIGLNLLGIEVLKQM